MGSSGDTWGSNGDTALYMRNLGSRFLILVEDKHGNNNHF